MSVTHQPIVLVVEDEPGVRQLSCTVLEQAGFTAVPACDGIQAMRLCRERDSIFDLLLTDVQLGCGPNGLELADAVRLLREDMAILIVSGNPGMEELASAKGYAFLAKPFMPTLLIECVRERLRDAAERKQENSIKRRMKEAVEPHAGLIQD